VSAPAACPQCLRRPWLLRYLAGFIERVASDDPGSRSPELLRLDDERLARAAAPKDHERILGEVARIGERRMRAEVEAAGCWACCVHDDRYPPALRDAADAPRALLGLGDHSGLDALDRDEAVTVVGARRASGYGRQVARALGHDLAVAGIVVVSGMAYGIDGAAHRGAIEVGRTIAVLGSGADVAYPAAHRALHRRIGEAGLVLSELAPGTTPWRWTFPARNRIMAALAGMTVVVEGASRSGSLITAQLADDLGRDVGAVPGPVNSRVSAGPNELLFGGAHVIRGAQDVLDVMLGPGVASVSRIGPPLDAELAEALSALEGCYDGTCDSVASELALSGQAAAVLLARLELLGYAECSTLGVYSRTPLEPPS
jgi:DNA processing protein